MAEPDAASVVSDRTAPSTPVLVDGTTDNPPARAPDGPGTSVRAPTTTPEAPGTNTPPVELAPTEERPDPPADQPDDPAQETPADDLGARPKAPALNVFVAELLALVRDVTPQAV
ncbi:hypothetical protein BA062_38760 [Prauserella flavalba]|uniref:Uncharacterized protein n=2 Tax=Prauserella flavalba TaxID=1477506 RepID=A0A318LEM5_9PSEU|nr:hypothetical protein BA062_38760 [Prauserella flavalba]